jgi:hypothetical protein
MTMKLVRLAPPLFCMTLALACATATELESPRPGGAEGGMGAEGGDASSGTGGTSPTGTGGSAGTGGAEQTDAGGAAGTAGTAGTGTGMGTGTGGAGTGGSSNCTETTATVLPASATTTVAGDACLKVVFGNNDQWMKKVTLQCSNSSYPVPFSFENCTSVGSGSFDREFEHEEVLVSVSCPLVLELRGGASSTISLSWWGS